MNYLYKLTCDYKGNPSSKRFVLVISGISLSLATLILSCAAVFGIDVTAPLTVIGGALAGMSGVSYVEGKKVDLKQRSSEQSE